MMWIFFIIKYYVFGHFWLTLNSMKEKITFSYLLTTLFKRFLSLNIKIYTNVLKYSIRGEQTSKVETFGSLLKSTRGGFPSTT